MAYLVPYYRGMNYADEAGLTMPALSGHSSDMASVDLNTSSYLSVRIHGVDTDFADFYTIDIVNDLPYSRGTGAYKVSYCVLEDGYGDACSLAFPCKNGEPCETVGRQANKHDLAKYAANDKLKGFFSRVCPAPEAAVHDRNVLYRLQILPEVHGVVQGDSRGR